MPAALILALTIPALTASAEPQLAVPAPRESAQRDATQEVKSGGVIRGRITSLDTAKPLRRAQVRLTADELVPPPPRTASTSSDGRYEFRDIPPGRYTLRVERNGYLALTYGQRRPGEQARPLEIADKEIADKVDFALPRMSVISGRVAGTDIDGLVIVTGSGGTIRGQVASDDGTPVPGVERSVMYARPLTWASRWSTGARLSTDGTFELKGVVGPVVLSIGTLTGDWTLKTIEREGRDLADDPIDVRHGETLNGVRVVLTTRPRTCVVPF